MSKNIMSIMVLSWNRLHYTKQTIERILQTTTTPNELILIDNNSTEESGVRQYLRTVKGNAKTQNIKHVFNDRNFGVGGGRNTGLLVAEGDYLVNIDDDVWVPDRWDSLFKQACDKVSNLGITGVNVEPHKYPAKVINGVRLCSKAGNLGGACLCIPRRVFEKIGFYMAGSIYGMEDAEMKCRLDIVKLLSAYIEPRGKHLDADEMKEYRQLKNAAHIGGSIQRGALAQFRRNLIDQHSKTGSVYVPFDPKTFSPVDEDIFTNDIIKGK